MPVYVQHEVLGKQPDVFNAEALWQAPGLALFARRPLLRDLLERSPREQRGRAATRCFSHVTLMLPQDEVDDDRHLTRGARVRDLAAALAALHQKDFGDLLGNDEVRYDVVGADTLGADEVAVRFGHAVYLPAKDEAVLYQVATSADSAIWRHPTPVYRGQRLALVDNDGGATILLINDGPEAPLEVQVRPKTAFDCSYDALGDYFVVRAKVGGSGAAPWRLLLRVTRMASATAADSGGRGSAGAAALTAPRPPSAAHPATAAGQAAPAPAPSAAVWQRRVPIEPRAAAVEQHPRADATVHAGASAAAARMGDACVGAAARAPIPFAGGHLPPALHGVHASPACGISSGDTSADAASVPSTSTSTGTSGSRRGAVDVASTFAPLDAVHAAATGAAGDAGDATDATDATDGTYAPLARQRVTLVALALPRLSRYRETGAAALEIGFDRQMVLAGPGSEAVISFAVDAADDLVAITRAGREPIGAPACFSPVDGPAVRVAGVAAAMAERYRALLILPEVASAPYRNLPVPSGARFVFGRGAPMLAALRVLDSPRFIGSQGSTSGGKDSTASKGASADRIGVSRTAFSFEATAAGFRIGRLSATQALFHLDEQLDFVAAIGGAGALDRDGGADADGYLLPPGHHLVAGHYVLRLDA